jgi:two-component system CheB/CheR fusion protein
MESTRDLEALLDYLKRNRGFDFTGYKRASLQRRITKRMEQVQIESYGDYLDYLEVHPEEFEPLFNTVLINVTSFFRDPPTWELLAQKVIPRLATAKGPATPIRVWSAGSASGEEAYTLAMLFCEVLGPDAFRERVKIYATDVDDDALEIARRASYSARDVEHVPKEMREKYFERNGTDFTVRKDVRRQVIFGRHDLVQDAPISRIDLLVCRNTLMYFNAEVQAKILARFHFALNPEGVLVLGRAETLLTHGAAFAPIDMKRRVSVKVSTPNLRQQLLLMAQAGNGDPLVQYDGHMRAREAAFDASPVAQLAIDAEGVVLLANASARELFDIGIDEVGRPLQDLRVSYKPVDLRSCLDQAYAERRPVSVKDVEWSAAPGDRRWLDVQVLPLLDGNARPMGATVTFIDVTSAKRMQQELEHSNHELETAYEELQSTNEELETTNEELQSTVEELETTNEELQSTNEELETMNEELHSTNEELHSINEELTMRSDELNEVNAFLASVLRSLRGAVVVLDRDLRVIVWSDNAVELWGLRSDEVLGKNFLSLDIGLPVAQLRQPLRAALVDGGPPAELTLPAVNRRGRNIECRITCMPLLSDAAVAQGVLMTIDPRPAPGAKPHAEPPVS